MSENELDDLVESFFDYTDFGKQHKKYEISCINIVPKKQFEEKPQTMEREHGRLEYVGYSKSLVDETLSQRYSKMNLTSVTGTTFLHNYSSSNATQTVLDESFSENYRSDLPIFKLRESIVEAVINNPVVIISGKTGCGKTTQVPQYIYDSCRASKKSCKILVSQPRKIAAITIAQRVAQERKSTLGYEVGYQVSLDKKCNLDDDYLSKIVYCTTGVILNRLINEKNMNRYSHIILDEVHERDINIDFLLLVIRRLMALNSPDTKIILMSATMDSEQFLEYFTVPLTDGDVYKPQIIDLSESARNFPIKEYFLKDFEALWKETGSVEDLVNYDEPSISEGMYDYAADVLTMCFQMQTKLTENHIKSPAILVFLPGIHEIERFYEKISTVKFEQYLGGLKVNAEICVLHSMLSVDEQRAAFVCNDKSKIILSTNIAESSVTIPNVTHVLDFCLTKYQATAKGAQISSLILDWSSRNNCTQRSGRCGRVCKGTVVRLVTKEFYDNCMKEYPAPEMKRIGLETVVIKIKMLEMGSLLEMFALAIDPPDKSSIVDAVLHLKELGGLTRLSNDGTFDYEDGDFTYVGRIMGSLPVDVRITKFFIVGYMFSVLEEVIIIGAGLNLKSIFNNSYTSKINNFMKKLSWANGSSSDCIAILIAYKLWKKNHDDKQFTDARHEIVWCKENGLDFKNLREMELLIIDIKKRLETSKIKILPTDQPTWREHEKIFVIKMCIAGAFGASNFFEPTANSQADERDASRVVNCLDLFRTVYFRNMDKNQVGEVYEEQIRKEFKRLNIIDDPTKVSCTFDPLAQKVFVTFHSDNPLIESDDFDDNVGKILPEVYRAVKLRQTKRFMSLTVMNHEKTVEYAVKQGLGSMVEGKFKKKSVFVEHPEWCVIPTTSTIKIHGFVTHVEHCNKFYYRPVKAFSQDNSRDFSYHTIYERIQDNLKSAQRSLIKDFEGEIKVGKFVVVAIGGSLHRGVFVSRKGVDSVTVKLTDMGYTLDADTGSVYVVTKEEEEDNLNMVPPRIFECTLTEIQPSTTAGCYVGKWTKEAIEEFKAIVNKKSTIHIYSEVNDVVSVKLMQKGVNWNLKLVSLGFAEDCEESYLSKMNHDYRIQRQSASACPLTPKEEFANRIDKRFASCHVKAPPLDECKLELKLLGPYSPLEIDLNGISRLVSKKVLIEGSSVNSVILNDDILNYRGKFCVAADMTINSTNQQITLRETTMMPGIPGLATLLAMIFSPAVELRRDETGSRYVSLLTGLGFDRVRGQPYYGERDALLEIDFGLTEDDVEIVNKLRFCLSQMLITEPGSVEPNLVDGDKATLLKKIQSLIIEIIVKQRPVMETCTPPNALDWNVDQANTVFRADPHEFNGLYGMIGIPKINTLSQDVKTKLLQHAEQLKRCATGSLTIDSKSQICRLCNYQWSTIPDLQLHLLSKKHISKCERLSNNI